jgi:hypothetical protein
MFRIGFYASMEAEQHHKQLIHEVEQYRMMKEAVGNKEPKTRIYIKMLALIGRELAIFGSNLEERYTIQSGFTSELNQHSNPVGCA